MLFKNTINKFRIKHPLSKNVRNFLRTADWCTTSFLNSQPQSRQFKLKPLQRPTVSMCAEHRFRDCYCCYVLLRPSVVERTGKTRELSACGMTNVGNSASEGSCRGQNIRFFQQKVSVMHSARKTVQRKPLSPSILHLCPSFEILAQVNELLWQKKNVVTKATYNCSDRNEMMSWPL